MNTICGGKISNAEGYWKKKRRAEEKYDMLCASFCKAFAGIFYDKNCKGQLRNDESNRFSKESFIQLAETYEPFTFVTMNTIAWIVYIVWFGSEIILNRMLRSRATDMPEKDKGSLRIIWVTIVVACFTAGFLTGVTFFPIYATAAWYYVALAIILAGVGLRLLAVYALGKFFTVDVTIREGHQLKQNGMYRYIRHPSYAASLLSFVGYGLSLNNWVSLLIVTVAVFAVFSYRIGIEEKVLAAQFGEAYTAYKKRTKRLLPFVY